MNKLAEKLLLSKGCPQSDIAEETKEFLTQLKKMSAQDGVNLERVLTLMYHTNMSYSFIVMNRKSEVI